MSCICWLASAASAEASVTCNRFAAPEGSDGASGTIDQPLRTAQKLASSLQQGETGCLRAGIYKADDQIKLSTPSVTLTSYPGERATLVGRVWVAKDAPNTAIRNLDLDGRNRGNLPSPTINAEDVVLEGNDITNHHTTICVSLGSPDTWGRARRTLIADNVIHDCGRMPATNQDHGIYVNSSDDAVIRGNWIYDNADRGIQLYSDAQRTLIKGNVIDGNGEGVIFSGDSDSASSHNIVENNVITNSRIRDNIDSWWGGRTGTGNIVRNNCIGGGPFDDGDGGIKEGQPGFRATGNLLMIPTFADRQHGDYTVAASSPCGKLLAGAAADPDPSDPPVPPVADPPVGNRPPTTEPAGGSPAVTIRPARNRVRVSARVRIRGRARGAGRVTIIVRRNGQWRRIGSDRTIRRGKYKIRVRMRHRGRQTMKAVAHGLRDSRPVRLRVLRHPH